MKRCFQNRLNFLMLLLFAVAFFTFLSGCTVTQSGNKTLVKEQIPVGQSVQNLVVADQKRGFLLYVPTSYDRESTWPLLFDFHGSGSNPSREVAYSDFINLAEQKGFILVAPTGIHDNNGKVSWNTIQDPKSVDDVAFVQEIIKRLSAELKLDSKRIFSAGMSGGARMSVRVACELSDTIAAIAPVAGIQFPADCAPSRAMPVIAFHGQDDMINHYTHQKHSRPYWKQGVESSVAGWVAQNGCDQQPQSAKISEVVTRLRWNKCRNGADVIFYQIKDGGHTWPGSPIVLTTYWSGRTNKDIIASDLIWDFFMAHPLP